MNVLIVGNGVQGKKRSKLLKKNLYLSVDKKDKKIKFIDNDKFDTVFLCVPEKAKEKLIVKYLNLNKNILVEKPLNLNTEKSYTKILSIAKKNKKFLYIAYNHRFEPSIIKAKKILRQKKIGKIFKIRIFYGNGTARLVKSSEWRDRIKNGILYDLGSHILDILNFLFTDFKLNNFRLFYKKFENKNPDYAQIILNKKIYTNIEMSYCSWKNSFKLEIIGSKGSIYIDNLCKWGQSTLEHHKRILPSGYPKIDKYKFKKGDPTWKREHYFLNTINGKFFTNIFDEIKIFKFMKKVNKK